MEPATLSQARRQLAARLALFTTGLLVVFLLETSSQLKESDRNLQQRQLQLLGQVATHHFRELNHSTPAPTAMAGISTKAVASGSTAAQIRILWLDRALTILDEYGSFRPGGALVPPAEQRHRTQWIRLSNGTGLWLPVSATADPGKPLGYIAVASSEAPYKREVLVSLVGATAASVLMALLGIAWILERSLQPLRAQINRLHEFAGDVAHELRNPLMALKASLANTRSLLRKDQPAPALTAVLGTLDRIGSRMTTILDDLLLLTRLDAGSDDPALNQSSVAITEVFDELAILHDGEAEEQQIALIFTVTTPMTLQIAPARLQRILSNLISNAIRFSTAGSSVRISASPVRGVGHICVDDAGPGIPREAQERVFQRRVRLNATTSSGAHAGLGLALSRSLAQLHGGSLRAQPSPQGGCRMLLQLPLQRTRPAPGGLGLGA